MSKDVGSMAMLLALVLALAAVFAPVAMTEEGVGCVENDVQVDGQELQLQSDGCEPEVPIVADGSDVCVKSELRIDGRAISLRSNACPRDRTGASDAGSAQPQAVARLYQATEIPSAPLRSSKPAAQGPLCRNYNVRLFPPV